MAANTSIEWTATVHPDGSVTPGRTWNPVRGCSVISPGCHNCYAMKMAHRFSGDGKPYAGLTKQTKAGPQWTGKIATIESALLEPLSWRKPAKVFVNSMSDLFHEDVSEDFIAEVFGVMAVAGQPFQGKGDGYTASGYWTDSGGKKHPVRWPKQKHGPHIFQVLTKRPDRMRRLLDGRLVSKIAAAAYRHAHDRVCAGGLSDAIENGSQWPLPNVWLGVSVENQKYADERIPHLLKTPAAVRFISAEPLLGAVNLGAHLPAAFRRRDTLDWVIVGGESGPGARPFDITWARSLVKQCAEAGVACFMKQLGAKPQGLPLCWSCGGTGEAMLSRETGRGSGPCGCRDGYQELFDRKGGDINEWPADLRVREFPRTAA